jgi:hypothetical protein
MMSEVVLFDIFEILKLFFGLIVLSLPGFFWSKLLLEKNTFLERLIFGFGLSIIYFIPTILILNVILDIDFSFTLILVLYLIYLLPAIILYIIKNIDNLFPKIKVCNILKKRFLILSGILFFIFLITIFPHIIHNYYLPFHVDEWINWIYAKSFIETGSLIFSNPYTGIETAQTLEPGFTISISLVHYISGANFQTIFLFMPSLIMILISLTVFNIGERTKYKYSLESAFLIGFIPTTIQVLGPSFFVAVMLGIFLIVFLIWLIQLKKPSMTLLTMVLLLTIFVVHPPSTFAAIIFLCSYTLLQFFSQEYNAAMKTGLVIISGGMILLIAYIFNNIWSSEITQLFSAFTGTYYPSILYDVWNQFILLGIPCWILVTIGIFYGILKKDKLIMCFILSMILFLIILGLYSNFGYGLPILFERGWLYLYVFATIVAGSGLYHISKDKRIKNFWILSKCKFPSRKIVPIMIIFFLIISIIPIHAHIPYYQIISEEEYTIFTWISDNINEYENEYNTFDVAAVDPDIAAAFSAITGIKTISSSMHPMYGTDQIIQMKFFLGRQCENISFLEDNGINIIYGKCNNSNLVKIHENVFIYYGITPSVNFSISNSPSTTNDTISFIANFSNSYGRIISWNWDFGDGNSTIGEIHGLRFDGKNDFVKILDNDIFDLTDQICLEIWANPATDTQKVAVLGKHSAYHFWLSNNSWSFGIFNNTGYTSTGFTQKIEINEPYQIIGIFNKINKNNNLQIWVNGTLSKQANYSQFIRTTEYPFYIGGSISDWGNVFFDGIISEVRLYNRALNETEIKENNNRSNEKIVSNGLIGWWKLDHMGNYVLDLINGNNGLIKGASWINSASHQYQKPGNYLVNLSVISNTGLTSYKTMEITIK